MRDLKLGKLEKNLKIEDFVLSPEGYVYRPFKILFFKVKNLDDLYLNWIINVGQTKKIGLILSKINKEQKQILESKRVSYIVPEKEACIFGKDTELTLKVIEKNESAFPYTKIISPAGLEIFDVLLTLPSQSLTDFTFSKLCQKYGLNQTKLSQISSVTEAKKPIELRNWILDRDIDWWTSAFMDAKTRRQLTPFENDLSLTSLGHTLPSIMSDLRKSDEWPEKVFYSGPELLKRAGYLKDPNYYLCCESGIEERIIKKYRLIPTGKSATKSALKISIIRKPFQKEAFFSKSASPAIYRYNTLRMLWGTQIEDERIQESRFTALRNYLNEAR